MPFKILEFSSALILKDELALIWEMLSVYLLCNKFSLASCLQVQFQET